MRCSITASDRARPCRRPNSWRRWFPRIVVRTPRFLQWEDAPGSRTRRRRAIWPPGPLRLDGTPLCGHRLAAAAVAHILGYGLYGVLVGRGGVHLRRHRRICAPVLQRDAQPVQNLAQHSGQVLGVSPAGVGDAESQYPLGLPVCQDVSLVRLHFTSHLISIRPR